MRTEAEIEKQLDAAADAAITSESRWPGMTYEQGVDVALRWALEFSDDPPMTDD